MRILPIAFLSTLGCVPAFLAGEAPRGTPVETAQIDHGELSVLFRDNARSPGVLSGIDALFNRRHAPGFDAFDPDTRGASAGLNFEHIIAGHENPHNFKSKLPRHPRPAWDFQYVIHRVETGREYGIQGRPVWKRFVSPEDCLREYERWACRRRGGNEK